MGSRGVVGVGAVRGALLVVALVASVLVAAPAAAAGGTLAGTLRGPNGGRFEYFRIDLYQAAGPDTWQLASSHQITSWDTGLPVGDFRLTVPAGTYRACFTALTFESVDNSGRGCWQDAFDVFGSTDIVVADGATTTITPRLPREARLRGRILGPGGVGVSAFLRTFRRSPAGTWEAVGGGQSLPDGSFDLPDVDPGTYRLCLVDVPYEYLPECWQDRASVDVADEVVLPPGTSPSMVFRLVRRATISGVVTRPAGSTQPAYVTAYWWRNARWEARAWAGIDANGSYRITGLDADTYRVCVDGFELVRTCWRSGSTVVEATDIVLTTSQARTGVNFRPGNAGYISGRLPAMYLGAEGFPEVTAWREGPSGWEAISSAAAEPEYPGTDWIYTIGSLAAGRYVVCVHHVDPEFVTAFPQTCHGPSPTAQGGIPVDVVAGATTAGVDIATGLAGEIRGRVVGATSAVRIDLYAPTGLLAVSQTSPDGRYRFGELPAGSYTVAFHRVTATTTLAAEWWRNLADGVGPAGATPIPVDGNVVGGINATLDVGATITGRLLDRNGAPVVGCVLHARGRPGGSLAIRRAVTGSDGSFAIGGLSVAPYAVVVPASCTGTSPLYYDAASPIGTTPRFADADLTTPRRGATVALTTVLRTG